MPQNNISLSYAIARRAMSMIAAQGRIGHLDNLGISQEDFNRVVSDVPWLGADRNRITVTLNTLLTGVLDAAGMPRFSLPAEWVAAGITLFVAPINTAIACTYVERPGAVSDIARGDTEFDRCTAQQLFALVVSLYESDEYCQARQNFESNTKLKLSKLMIDEKTESTKNAKRP